MQNQALNLSKGRILHLSENENDPVDRHEFESFKKNVIDFLGLLVQAFDKNTNITKSTQASINNLTEAIEDLAQLHQLDADRNYNLLSDIHKKLTNERNDE